MKMLKYLLSLLLVAALVTASTGCYVISGQKMSKVKGTYKLTQYTRTAKYERKEGYTPTPTNYIEDAEHLYEEYLVITGSGKGYYVHKDAHTPAYSKEITLSYEYDPEDSSRIEYVIFNDALSVNANDGINRLGVTKERLAYTKTAIDYTELITKRPMRTEAISVRWERVSKATDLSYVEKQLGTVKKYDYEAYGVRGIYELSLMTELETGSVSDRYRYFYYVIDTAAGAETASVHYALRETPTARVDADAALVRGAEGWSVMTVDGVTFTLDPQWGTYYYGESEGCGLQIRCVSDDISDKALDSLIQSRVPTAEQ